MLSWLSITKEKEKNKDVMKALTKPSKDSKVWNGKLFSYNYVKPVFTLFPISSCNLLTKSNRCTEHFYLC